LFCVNKQNIRQSGMISTLSPVPRAGALGGKTAKQLAALNKDRIELSCWSKTLQRRSPFSSVATARQ
jgi:hypothetical protein